MDAIRTRRIGATRLEVPVLGLGGSTLGGFRSRKPISDAAAAAVYEAAWQAGVRYFDTAPRYGARQGERRLGRALAGGRRDLAVISTKTGITADVAPGPGGTWGVRCDYGHDATLRSIETSLRLLGTDRLDIVLVHDFGPETHGSRVAGQRFAQVVGEAIPALARLRDAGTVSAVGIGVASIELCLRTLEEADLDVLVLAGRYTVLDHRALEVLLPACEQRGVSVIVAAPYNGGLLMSDTAVVEGLERAHARARSRSFARVCAQYGASPGAVALQFPLAHRAVAAVIVGPSEPGQVAASMAWFREPVPAACWSALQEAGLIDTRAPVPQR